MTGPLFHYREYPSGRGGGHLSPLYSLRYILFNSGEFIYVKLMISQIANFKTMLGGEFCTADIYLTAINWHHQLSLVQIFIKYTDLFDVLSGEKCLEPQLLELYTSPPNHRCKLREDKLLTFLVLIPALMSLIDLFVKNPTCPYFFWYENNS